MYVRRVSTTQMTVHCPCTRQSCKRRFPPTTAENFEHWGVLCTCPDILWWRSGFGLVMSLLPFSLFFSPQFSLVLCWWFNVCVSDRFFFLLLWFCSLNKYRRMIQCGSWFRGWVFAWAQWWATFHLVVHSLPLVDMREMIACLTRPVWHPCLAWLLLAWVAWAPEEHWIKTLFWFQWIWVK